MMSLCVLQINHVIQYDFPTSVTDYLHRVGRTGRVGGVTQCLATTLMTKKKDVRVALKIEVQKSVRGCIKSSKYSTCKELFSFSHGGISKNRPFSNCYRQRNFLFSTTRSGQHNRQTVFINCCHVHVHFAYFKEYISCEAVGYNTKISTDGIEWDRVNIWVALRN